MSLSLVRSGVARPCARLSLAASPCLVRRVSRRAPAPPMKKHVKAAVPVSSIRTPRLTASARADADADSQSQTAGAGAGAGAGASSPPPGGASTPPSSDERPSIRASFLGGPERVISGSTPQDVARKTYKEMMASLEGLAKDSVEAAVAKRAAGGGPSARRAQKEGEGDVHEFMERMAELIVEEGEAKKGKERREARYKGTARGARAASSTAAAGTGAQAAAGAASAASAAAAAASGASNAPGAGATDGGAGASYAGASANYGAPTASTHAAGAEEVILFRGPCSTKWQLSWLCGLMTLTAGALTCQSLYNHLVWPLFPTKEKMPELVRIEIRTVAATGALLVGIGGYVMFAAHPARVVTRLSLLPRTRQLKIRTATSGLVGSFPRFLQIGPFGRLSREAGFHLTSNRRDRIVPLSGVFRNGGSAQGAARSALEDGESRQTFNLLVARARLFYTLESAGGRTPRAETHGAYAALFGRLAWYMRSSTEWEGVREEERVEKMGARKRTLDVKEPYFVDRQMFDEVLPMMPLRK